MTRNHITRDKMEDESQEQADAIAELIEERLSLRVSVDCLCLVVGSPVHECFWSASWFVSWLLG